MKLRRILLTSSALLCATPALAQVSIPLPGGRSSPTSAPAPPIAQPAPSPDGQVTVPLPGGTPAPPKPLSPAINPYNRDIDLTVPLTYRDRILGDIPVLITKDSRFFVYRETFGKLIDSLLNEGGKTRLANKLGQLDRFSPENLVGTGLELQYDPSTLSIVILSIDAGDRVPERLFEQPKERREEPDLKPAGVSGYLNVNLAQSYQWSSGRNVGPSAFFSGAFRVGGFVLEGEGNLADNPTLNGTTSKNPNSTCTPGSRTRSSCTNSVNSRSSRSAFVSSSLLSIARGCSRAACGRARARGHVNRETPPGPTSSPMMMRMIP